MQPQVMRHMFKSLVTQAGGKEAAKALIDAATGQSISIGTLSGIESGKSNVPLLWAWVLQDATGNHCFDAYRATTSVTDSRPDADPYALLGEASKEHGEAIEAGLRAARSSSNENWSRAAVEHREAADKHSEMASLCEARAAGPVSIKAGGK